MKKWEKNEKLQRLSHALNCVGRLARFAKKLFSAFFQPFFFLDFELNLLASMVLIG